mgnify:CR=1 FL=1
MLAAIAAAKKAVPAVMAATKPDAVLSAFKTLKAATDKLDCKQPSSPDDPRWHDVADALHEFATWLGQPADGTKRVTTRDQKIKLATMVLTGSLSSRGQGLAKLIVRTFEKGLIGIVKLAYHTLRLAVRGTIGAARLAAHGIVHVAEHMRGGHTVHAYDRQPGGHGKGPSSDGDGYGGHEMATPPRKGISGAHLLYR